ncbi:transcription termination factor Rho [Candidatus Roizmanbacteria bacterium RIFOXYC1_FULL_41_16]|nr:MAG: transcription termination factor Rho [Candidatus Roizmanbacteria bacterium RIFOXYB1_FULL_41_27]OGK72488.1 MAG: transcription termination factor Rho [Candidatus Roizmanbacteria bacterium RIFOXYC1_FULL_41_16]
MPIKKAKAATESDQTQETIDVSQLINNEMASVERPATTVPETISEPISTVSEPVNATASDMENEHDFEKRIQDDLRQAFEVGGFLDIINTSYGFLRPNFASSKDDVYVSMSQVRKFRLRQGDEVIGLARPPKQNERFHGLLKITKINGVELKNGIPLERKKYSELTPIYPDKQIKMEYDTTILSTRILDMMAPIGFGQRGLIVSPPKAGKTILLKEIANGLAANYPKAHIMALLIGERPEEVTDMKRSIKGEVVASNFDESPEHQTSVAELGLERAKRLTEMGRDVIIILDSITRLARAYNLNVGPSGKTLSGGFDPAALYPAKKFLGAARNCEEGGSLTIIGTALIETGSRMDDLIYEEFKGTGNMEIHLERKLAERRIYPAINIERSGTRHDELLMTPEKLKKVNTLRNMLMMLNDDERLPALLDKLSKNKNNLEFLEKLGKS